MRQAQVAGCPVPCNQWITESEYDGIRNCYQTAGVITWPYDTWLTQLADTGAVEAWHYDASTEQFHGYRSDLPPELNSMTQAMRDKLGRLSPPELVMNMYWVYIECPTGMGAVLPILGVVGLGAAGFMLTRGQG